MQKRPPSKTWPFVALVLLGAWAPSAAAYLDPGSGSLFLQLIVGGIAGIGLTLKLYWHKVLSLFGGRKREQDPPSS